MTDESLTPLSAVDVWEPLQWYWRHDEYCNESKVFPLNQQPCSCGLVEAREAVEAATRAPLEAALSSAYLTINDGAEPHLPTRIEKVSAILAAALAGVPPKEAVCETCHEARAFVCACGNGLHEFVRPSMCELADLIHHRFIAAPGD